MSAFTTISIPDAIVERIDKVVRDIANLSESERARFAHFRNTRTKQVSRSSFAIGAIDEAINNVYDLIDLSKRE